MCVHVRMFVHFSSVGNSVLVQNVGTIQSFLHRARPQVTLKECWGPAVSVGL